jgi:hypothetical protein
MQLGRCEHSLSSEENVWPWLDEDEDGEDGGSERLSFCGIMDG